MKIVIADLEIEADDFVYADGVKIGKYIRERRTVQFLDRDRRRSSKRGSNRVEVSLSQFMGLGTLLVKRIRSAVLAPGD